MENIVLARIDDRLIHGQVMTAWMKTRPAKRILVIDDKVAADAFMIEVIELAAPTGVKVDVYSCDQAIEALKNGIDTPTILLAKVPDTYKRLMDGGIALGEINLGGMGMAPGRKTLYKNIAASEVERSVMKGFLAQGIDIKIQIIPSENCIEIGRLL
ncbi:PTS system, mannose-specific IIB component [Propionispira arboris]|uniref:PTS system, mannose-specific IIB component n=1 Tax=Propionispira arboris TaxID=84035 RepID=A0A1H7BXM9_9FIRM|nr:PTS sugar transporter subunit IIB [Propionispira arboris]SEJ82403.1 PTS system, mannose-specific IIB component [Propionispira arboris]